jgi:hypothetical protein
MFLVPNPYDTETILEDTPEFPTRGNESQLEEE